SLHCVPRPGRALFADSRKLFVAGGEQYVHQFMEESERARLRHLLAVDSDDRKRITQDGEPTNLVQGHAWEEEDKEPQALSCGPPGGPRPPLIWPSQLCCDINSHCQPEPSGHFGRRFP